MYSMVLMMAMGAGAPEVPSFHPHQKSAVVVSGGCSWQGSGYATSWSQGCYAVTQWSAHPGFQYSSGCIGSCQGCCGGVVIMSGCTGCCGGCTGCQGGVVPQQMMPILPAQPVEQQMSQPGEKNGVVAIRVPADATVYANGVKVDQQGGERRFATTELEAGQDYKYTIRVDYLREGQPVSETRELAARAGQVTNAEFTGKPRQLTRSEVTVRMPSGSKLLVNGVEKKVAEDGRFETPILPAGEPFFYTFTAVADGKETSRQVGFKAGEALTVDLREAAAAK